MIDDSAKVDMDILTLRSKLKNNRSIRIRRYIEEDSEWQAYFKKYQSDQEAYKIALEKELLELSKKEVDSMNYYIADKKMEDGDIYYLVKTDSTSEYVHISEVSRPLQNKFEVLIYM